VLAVPDRPVGALPAIGPTDGAGGFGGVLDDVGREGGVGELAGAVLEALGATRWDHQQERGYDFWVLRDPWANEFCVLDVNFPDLLAQRPSWPE
jgi:hypothetical protein